MKHFGCDETGKENLPGRRQMRLIPSNEIPPFDAKN
jgi:hypothetical protein